jgi:hypothetical protein
MQEIHVTQHKTYSIAHAIKTKTRITNRIFFGL